MDSSFIISSPESDSQVNTTELTQPATQNSTTSTTTTPTTTTIRESVYNKETYTLEPNNESKIYIFRNGLFTRILLLINFEKDREIEVKCTT